MHWVFSSGFDTTVFARISYFKDLQYLILKNEPRTDLSSIGSSRVELFQLLLKCNWWSLLFFQCYSWIITVEWRRFRSLSSHFYVFKTWVWCQSTKWIRSSSLLDSLIVSSSTFIYLTVVAMVASMIEISVQLTRTIVPVIIFLGVVSNALNMVILTRATLIQHACSLYFLAMAINNICYCTILLSGNLLADGYQLELTSYSSFFCKVISYLLNLSPSFSVYLIVFASIDRYCASSHDARRRQFSTARVARRVISALFLAFAFVYSGAFITFDVWGNGPFVCVAQFDQPFNQFFITFVLTLYTIIAPACMICFGLLTIKNTKQLPVYLGRISRYRRTESQLSRMLLVQVGTQILLTLPFCVVFFILVILTSLQSSADFSAVLVIAKLPFYLTFTTAFFLYTMSGQAYRQEFFRLLSFIRPLRRVQPIAITAQTIRLRPTSHASDHWSPTLFQWSSTGTVSNWSVP